MPHPDPNRPPIPHEQEPNDPLRPPGDPDVRPDEPSSERVIASFSPERKTAEPLRVTAPDNPTFESSFDEFAGSSGPGGPTSFAERGQDYAGYHQAFEFGRHMAAEKRFAGQGWVNAEAEVRSEWERAQERSWSDASGAVRAGWEEARGSG